MLRSKKLCLTALAGWVLVSFTGTAAALGLGQPVSRAVLGEPLSVTVPVRLNPGEDLDNECVAADVFYGDDKLGSAAVDVNMSPAGAGQRMVRIKTSSRVNEPVFTVYLVVGCQTKVTRKFVGFADPPGMDVQPAQVVAAEVPREKPAVTGAGDSSLGAPKSSPVTPADVKSAALPSLSVSGQSAGQTPRQAAGKSRTDKPAPRSSVSRQATGASSAPKPVAPPTSLARAEGLPRQAKSSKTSDAAQAAKWSSKLDDRAPRSDGSRLELDPAAADALVEPQLAMTGGMVLPEGSMDSPELQERRAAAAALWAAMNASPEQLARDRQRMVDLESRLARLQLDAAAASKKLQDMESRVREAEEGRFKHPLVYALAGVCLLLAGALAWIFMRQRGPHAGSTGDWWRGQADDTASSPVEPSLAAGGADLHDDLADTYNTQPGALLASPELGGHGDEGRPAAGAPGIGVGNTVLASQLLAAAQGALADGGMGKDDLSSTQPVSIRLHEPVREMSVEELIDLEQQAEFFVVLGQDQAATELLESHVQSSKGATPLPYLKLLEIYKRLGQRDDYERVQQAFNQRFNAYAPSWESDLQQGHALQDYPGVVERLQALWSQPRRAMEVLQHSLTRPDDTVETFDLPAYRELLMLYSVARDLSDRQTDELVQVDIDVPDLEIPSNEASDTVVAPLTATRPVKAEPKVLPALSVDFSLDDVPGAPAASAVPEAVTATAHASTMPPRDDLGPIEFVVVPDEPAPPKA